MKIGLTGGLGGANFDALVADAKDAADRGFSSYWLSQIVQQAEAMQLIGAVAQQVPDIEFGTAVVPTYARHPMVMAEQAMTTSLLSGGRFTLGIGLSHQIVVEAMWGYSWSKPVRHAREYLDALMPLVRGEAVSFAGEEITARGQLQIPAETPSVVFAALGPQMLKLCGERCDGTVTWMTGAATLGGHSVPTIGEAAESAGRPAPRVIAGFPVWVTDDVDAARANAAETFAMYGQLPSYRAMLDREGLEGPADLAIVGDEATCAGRLDELAAAGVTEFNGAVFAPHAEGRDRSRAFLATRL
jgi:F420-dependent oxidoreductase-like protein